MAIRARIERLVDCVRMARLFDLARQHDVRLVVRSPEAVQNGQVVQLDSHSVATSSLWTLGALANEGRPVVGLHRPQE